MTTTSDGGAGFPWPRMESVLAHQAVSAVHEAVAANTAVHTAEISDLYARDMLVLWPSISVGDTHIDTCLEGDRWAERLTTHAGQNGDRWTDVARHYRRTAVAAARRATWMLTTAGVVDPEFAVVVRDEHGSDELLRECLTPTQLRRRDPRLHRRYIAEEALRALSGDARIAALVRTLADDAADPGLHRSAHSMLADLGAPAAIAMAEELRLFSLAPNGSLAPQRMLSVLEETRTTDDRAIDTLLAIVGDDRVPPRLRADVGACLSWLNQLGRTAPLLDLLPDDLVCDVLGAPYLRETTNGPLNYRPLEQAIVATPRFDEQLFLRLSATRIHRIRSADVSTATAALSSPSRFVRRHAAIVLLSVHV
ncbi:hypothetical protein AAFP35_12280 [Gordonia sp. CPCC 206044]|uniref:hypothetical protein n=1 Tax=Gordonia sp. CPCC 206044 TaxID=3140793 RepID=UPI003AF39711